MSLFLSSFVFSGEWVKKMKRQRRIDTFFSSQRESCTYFFLDWSSTKPVVKWLKEKPLGIQWESEVMWKEMKLFVTLGSNQTSSSKESEKPSIDTSLLSLIKSNLQKCVRRQLTEKALETAQRFMEWDMSHFLRRLSIIMMEDVMLHESLPVIIWLTAAESKGFFLSRKIQQWLLSVVDYLCQEKRESYWSLGISNQDQSLLSREKEFYQEAKKRSQKDLIFSLLFRKSYGGMQGDCVMMMSFASHLCQEKCPVSDTPLLPLDRVVRPIALEKIETCAVDFHCYPQLLAQLCRIYKDIGEKDMKLAVWNHNSRTNYRIHQRNLPETERIKMNHSLKIWFRIRNRIELIQKEYIITCTRIC